MILRWHIQRGDIVFPKTLSTDRMHQNITIFDFELTPDETAAIDSRDRGADGRVGPHPDMFDMM